MKSGRLIIKAREEKNSRLKELRKRCKSDCKKDAACQSRCDQIYISSGRVRSFKKFDIAPGMKGYSAIKVSAKIKASPGIGIWPALWMLPTGSDDKCSGCGHYGTWAASGEIDIFESVNNMDEVRKYSARSSRFSLSNCFVPDSGFMSMYPNGVARS